MEPILFPVAQPLVVQHNALVNARFDLNTNESRLFMALLARVQREDVVFTKCRIAVRDIIGNTASKSTYDKVRRMLKDFAGRTLLVEQLSTTGLPQRKPNFTVLPLLAFATYLEGEGMIEAQFNDLLLPYLVQLRDNFTKAQLTELFKLKSASSYRIYWLLREYASFGKRTIQLTELKAVLGLNEEYDRFNNFRARVLERAKAELAETDLPFTYDVIKQGREVVEIKFMFPSSAVPSLPLKAEDVGWRADLLAVGISVMSLTTIETRLKAGDYDEGYIQFVLETVRKQVKAGKVKKEGGAVFKALTDGYLLDGYRKAQQSAISSKVRVNPSLAAQRKKLLSALDDANGSLKFVQTAVLYTEETRPAAIAEVQEVINKLQQQLQSTSI